jgi:hypothetical protein
MGAKRFVAGMALAGLVGGMAIVGGAGAAGAASVVPDLEPGENPTCAGLGYSAGERFDQPGEPSGTYPVGGGFVTFTTDGTTLSWTSTVGIDAVVMKGGNAANVYRYDPPAESYGDTGLVSPDNSSGGPAALSHVDFCFDYDVVVTKTAATSLTRTYDWDIDKSVSPAAWHLFRGDSGTSAYTVSVTRTAVDSDWRVSGTISIYNPDPTNPATVTAVGDMVSPDIAAAVSCPSTPFTVEPMATVQCTYSTGLPDGSQRMNTATVTTSGLVGGGTGQATVSFTGAAVTEVGYPQVTVYDTNGSSWAFTGTGSVSYSKTFDCDADEGTQGNTATIDETGEYDEASVTVDCYELNVIKTAATSYVRTVDWDIRKTANATDLVLAIGQQYPVTYTVTLYATASYHDFVAEGDVVVHNPAPIAATINSVTDIMSGVGNVPLSCGVTFPYPLAAGADLICSYSQTLPGTATRTNTATAELQNYDYPAVGTPTLAGTTAFTGAATVSFAGAATMTIDDCLAVDDTLYGSLGWVCFNGTNGLQQTFTYQLMVGPYEECGMYEVTNIASFVTGTTGSTGSATWTIDVRVPCPGCTLTQGYWKTHSSYGPAPYDDAWALIEEDTTFFQSGQSYYQVLWTPPAGTAYYVLAHQYIAAKLNILNGASSTPSVDAAIAWAESFFGTYTPSSTLSRSMRNQVLTYATTLDQYNNGYLGPGHCSE